jgi:hypothetical protein
MTKALIIATLSGLLAGASAAADRLTHLSSEFQTPAALSGWREHTPIGFSPKWEAPMVANGALILKPKSSGWFEDNQAGHLFKPVTGDFIVTTQLTVCGTTTDIPQTEFSLAGLFVRVPRSVSAADWQPGQENWLFLSVGTASPAGAPQYEIKTTTNSVSTLKILPAQPGSVQLRMARHGELFTLMVRPNGQKQWRVVDQFIRPDLPETLNVGLTAYADYGSVAPTYPNYLLYNTKGAVGQKADLIARVDWIRFRQPKTQRFPIANIDAPASFGADVIKARREDLMAD